ncbi:hypothetical protein D9M69_710720 [compost metagenome]
MSIVSSTSMSSSMSCTAACSMRWVSACGGTKSIVVSTIAGRSKVVKGAKVDAATSGWASTGSSGTGVSMTGSSMTDTSSVCSRDSSGTGSWTTRYSASISCGSGSLRKPAAN